MRENLVRVSDAERELIESVCEKEFEGDAPLGLAIRVACEEYINE